MKYITRMGQNASKKVQTMAMRMPLVSACQNLKLWESPDERLEPLILFGW